MNIIVGLCVGHDMLFASTWVATTPDARDRDGHNPIAVLTAELTKRLQRNIMNLQ
jgi:uncharacterized metal-binding protein